MSQNSKTKDETPSKRRGRTSSLPLAKQKGLFRRIIAEWGGLYTLNIEEFLKEEGISRDKTEGRAVVNLINNCKHKPAAYERLQIDLFGSILEPTTVVDSPAIVKKKLAPVRRPASSSVLDLSSAFKTMSVNDYFGSVEYDDTLIVNLEQGWRNREIMAFNTPGIEVGENPVYYDH